MSQLMQLYKDNAQRVKTPVNAARNKSEASIYIYDVIDADYGVSAVSVIDALASVADSEALHIYINSAGGDVFEGRAIMAEISRFKGKTIAHIDSLCASAATSIALACNEVEMSDGALFMIHNASAMVWGDKQAMRDTADLLQKIELSIITDYTTKTGKPADAIAQMMDSETWMTAQEALDHGFIDRISTGKSKASNAWNLASYKNAPIIKEVAPEVLEIAPIAASYSATRTNQNRLALIEIL